MKRFGKISKVFKKPAHKTLALTMAFSILFQLGAPTCALALTGGPSQPEVQSFEPVGTSDMVNLFGGSFNYNIPLLNVDGYPINICYHSGVTMDQEASWVGLGWNINPGVINREIRGIPDDFDGENIERDFHMKDNHTYGLTTAFGAELFGNETIGLSVTFGIGVHYNNYTGVGADLSLNAALSVGGPAGTGLTLGLGITSSSDEGVTITPSLGIGLSASLGDGASVGLGLSVGCSFNSRQGLQTLTIGASVSIAADVQGHSESLGGITPTATYNLMQTTYTPQVTLPMNNLSITGSVKFGAELFGLNGTFNLEGYYSSTSLAQTVIQNPAFGYMHADEGVHYSNAMMDFNREKDMPFTSTTPDLPLANFTYDIMAISGQGISGSYRPFRSDIGHVFDPAAANTGTGYSLGGEVGIGDLFHAGLDYTANYVNTYSSDWLADNNSVGGLSYKSFVPGNPLYEPVYFKEANEKSIDPDPSFFAKVGGFDPQRVNLDEVSQFNTIAQSTYSSGLPVTSNNYRNNRDIRNQGISFLTHQELLNGAGLEDPAYISANVSSGAKPYHIGEVTTLGTDGRRYVYGIAAYNNLKDEVTFAVGEQAGGGAGDAPTQSTNMVQYQSGDNSTSNGKGVDNYYSKIITPPYAHSYLLTSVLSPDYVDADGIIGPSAGDLGTWTKFGYNKIPNYNWRVPLGANQATFNEGLKSDPTDDKANYLYGSKDLWYLQTIQTKNYIAVFSTSNRQDGYGAVDENGAVNFSGPAEQKLDKISLYTIPNYNAHLANVSIPLIPIEEVHFVYDYSLCPGVPNNSTGGQGKLTLRQIYFTYQNSNKGRLSPYQFSYSSFNPPYNIKDYDRWGYFMQDQSASYAATGFPSPAPPFEFPYVNQNNKAQQDQWMSAWTMTDIVLPSGGSIHVDYESNDYAYVQNLQAGQMFRIESSSIGTPQETIDQPTPLSNPPPFQSNNPLVFKLQQNPDGSYITDLSKYFNGITNVYFRFLMQITPGNYEYVSGYAPIDSYGLASSQYGWVKLQGVALDANGSGTCSPIVKAAIQYGRINTPRLVWSEPPITDGDGLLDVMTALISAFTQLLALPLGLNGSIFDKGDCYKFVVDKSWIRLDNPNSKKLGGGARVKDVMMNDNWNVMTANAEQGFDYGQEYTYTLADGVTSSGVASYEPQIGGDENPWRQPVFYDSQSMLIPDDKHYMEKPFGESFFPSASIGYSQVTVKNLHRAGVHRDATGTVVHQFYTTKDFPTITNNTGPQEIREKSDPTSIASLFNIDVKDYMTASEGYVIELNDMNGKPAAQYVYQEDQTQAISSIQYYYQRTPYLGDGSFRLDNTVTAVNKDGSLNNSATMGVFFDDVADFRQSQTTNVSSTVMGNVDGFLVPFLIVIPMFLPSFASSDNRFRSNVTTKVIQRFGILDSTAVTDLGSRVTTQNLAYDAESGQVLLTKTANDFQDPIYNLNYPAYWHYDGMGPAYQNIGLTVGISFTSPGNGIVNNASSLFAPGDEIFTSDGKKGWVINVSGNTIIVEDKTGALLSSTGTALQITRSGRRNMQDMDMEKLTTLAINPLSGLQSNTFQNVTEASAQVYGDAWSTYCQCFEGPNATDNPYVLGIAGNFRLKTSFLYLTPRDQSNFDNNTNVRKDGIFTSYNPFYSNSAGNWTITPDNWTYTSTVTNFNPYGQEIEDQDALGRYSSASFGYNQTLPTAVAANSKYQEMAFDGFEDYGFNGCADNHLDVPRSLVTLDNTQSHTGRHSVKIPAGDSLMIGGALTTCTPFNPCNLTLCDSGQFFGGALQDIKFRPQGGMGPYTYSYKLINGYGASSVTIGNDGSIFFNGFPGLSSSGTYVLTVTDANGCTFTVTFGPDVHTGTITTNPSLASCTCNVKLCYSLVASTALSEVEFEGIGGTPPYTFSESGVSTPSPTFVVSGGSLFAISPITNLATFTITVTDANGCTFSAPVTVHFNYFSSVVHTHGKFGKCP